MAQRKVETTVRSLVRQATHALLWAAVLFAACAVLVLALDSLARTSLLLAWNWAAAAPAAFFVNVLLLAAATLASGAFVGYRVGFVLCGLIGTGLALGSKLKLDTLGYPIVAADVYLYRQVLESIRFVAGWPIVFLAGALAVAVAASFATGMARTRRLSWARAIVGIAAAWLLVQFAMAPLAQLFDDTRPTRILRSVGIENLFWDPTENLLRNGIVLSFVWSLGQLAVDVPSNEIGDPARAATGQLALKTNAVANRPVGDVVVILSEAFVDPASWPGLQFDTGAPLDALKPYAADVEVGSFYVPTYGGLTCNAEFELLTGMSTIPFPPMSAPYSNYIKSPVPSLAWRFKKAGYETLAVHPFVKKFWNRDLVYPLLGFDQFQDIVHFSVGPETRVGAYVSDAALTDAIIARLDQPADRGRFIFAVSIQNHGRWFGKRSGLKQRSFGIDGRFSGAIAEEIRTYVNGTFDAVDALAKLLEHGARHPERPLTVLFFGDHLPALGNAYGFYREAAIVSSVTSSQWSANEMERMRTTTYVAYSNAGKLSFGGKTAALLAGRQLGDWLGLPDTNLDVSNRGLEQQYLAVVPGLAIGRDGTAVLLRGAEGGGIFRQHHALQHYYLFGRGASPSQREPEWGSGGGTRGTFSGERPSN